MGWKFAQDLRWLLAGFDLVMRASRRGRKAKRLQKAGRHLEAMAEVTIALDLLARPRVNRVSPPTALLILRATLLMDEIATALGTPSAVRVPLEDALKVIGAFRGEVARRRKIDIPNVVELHPENDDPLREYERWFQCRLERLGVG